MRAILDFAYNKFDTMLVSEKDFSLTFLTNGGLIICQPNFRLKFSPLWIYLYYSCMTLTWINDCGIKNPMETVETGPTSRLKQ